MQGVTRKCVGDTGRAGEACRRRSESQSQSGSQFEEAVTLLAETKVLGEKKIVVVREEKKPPSEMVPTNSDQKDSCGRLRIPCKLTHNNK